MAYLYIDDDEPEKPLPSREEAEAEIADWKRRIDALYDEIVGWLPPGEGYEVDRSRLLPRHENMQKILELPGYEIPLLRIRRDGRDILMFQPDARWVLFTRGRVKLYVGTIRAGDRLLAKEADAEGPEWTYWTTGSWQTGGKPWGRECLLDLLREVG
ncbi:hypothetical protein F1643_01970 [Azospirillum sp. INR13]|uniref:hypothetical protein n=1 Tax=Azospirillum sp. INR13 TaxID=2596919 RepID=UPI0018922EC9|nr:hypothetical protein [Azospirillum sp. INR13]MBF5093417.1 hypothetical protein [Azospirillum sp. INR13]